jgi:hypothetical protein
LGGRRSKGRRDGELVEEKHECRRPPCIHIVVDERRRIFKIFVEDYNVIAPVPIEAAREACRKLRELESLISRGYREAEGDEIDFLARKYLGAEPVEEEVVDREE